MNLSALKPSQRRRYSPEFKRQVINQCQPGVSVAGVALAHGLNANMLRGWIKRYRPEEAASPDVPSVVKLVPVQVAAPVSVQDDAISLKVRRGNVQVDILWPATGAANCAQWLSAWLK